MLPRVVAGTRRRRVLRLHPAQAVVLGFASAVLVGTALLALPISAADRRPTDLVDALFTAVSAVCVTGLVTLDTATHWSGFGLAVILVLIQLGGLGIMVFATLIGLVLVRRLSVRSRLNAAAETDAVGSADVRRVVRGILSCGVDRWMAAFCDRLAAVRRA
ncbi:potassium transporter TrkG [Microbacterium aurantiacum]|uniref:Uncharacterized protein n=1 Tax=Microbacterium aurantiacum TaxID=162393 RepID=A0AAJ2HK87_9MICO|nr:potassium transporter TrkG [Microbacterium aurantiacum]MDS0245496.1 hypothetical protein [Microbacterium aurantiacum]